MYIPSVLKFKIEFGLSFLSNNSATARFFYSGVEYLCFGQ